MILQFIVTVKPHSYNYTSESIIRDIMQKRIILKYFLQKRINYVQSDTKSNSNIIFYTIRQTRTFTTFTYFELD